VKNKGSIGDSLKPYLMKPYKKRRKPRQPFRRNKVSNQNNKVRPQMKTTKRVTMKGSKRIQRSSLTQRCKETMKESYWGIVIVFFFNYID
jgi:hypothetical protein